METQKDQFNKNVVIAIFSIFGVGVFKAVKAHGASANMRMRAALHEIDRDLMQRLDRYISMPKAKQEEMGADVYSEKRRQLSHARGTVARIKTCLADSLTRPDVTHLKETGEVGTWTTEYFLDQANEVYNNNTEHFLEVYSDINGKIDEYIANAKLNPPARRAPTDYVPELYILTGGPFGNAPFHAILSGVEVQELGKGNPVRAVRTYCHQQLFLLKSSRLSSYLRRDFTDDQRQELRNNLIQLDTFIEQLNEVTVVRGCSLYSELSLNGYSQPHGISIQKISDAVTTETELRLHEYFKNLLAGTYADVGLELLQPVS